METPLQPLDEQSYGAIDYNSDNSEEEASTSNCSAPSPLTITSLSIGVGGPTILWSLAVVNSVTCVDPNCTDSNLSDVDIACQSNYSDNPSANNSLTASCDYYTALIAFSGFLFVGHFIAALVVIKILTKKP